MTLDELAARESIRDLVARYNQNGDSGRIDAMLALFAEDAVMEVVPDEVYHGVDAIRAFMSGVTETGGIRALRHFTATHQIDLHSPDEASGRSYYVVFTDRGLDHWGRYVDGYRRVEGRWRFASRRVSIDGTTPGGWAERRRTG